MAGADGLGVRDCRLAAPCREGKVFPLERKGIGMDEKTAKALAEAIGGEEWQSGGGIYVVAIRKPSGAVVVISDDLVAEYEDEDSFEASQPKTTIELREDPEEYWVVYD